MDNNRDQAELRKKNCSESINQLVTGQQLPSSQKGNQLFIIIKCEKSCICPSS